MAKQGFTLIEFMAVVAISSLISSIVLTALSPARAKAQTTKRVQDVEQVKRALELFAVNNGGQYPVVNNPNGSHTECWECGDSAYYITGTNKLATLANYLSVRPSDPVLPSSGRFADHRGYWYKSDGSDYKFTNLTDTSQTDNIPSVLQDSTFQTGQMGISVSSSARSQNWTASCIIGTTSCPEPASPPPSGGRPGPINPF